MDNYEYERKRRSEAERSREKSRNGRDIAPCPEVVDRQRREKALAELRFFLEAYFPLTFSMAWCSDHLSAIARLEQVIIDGGQFALAMPRGSGKTSLEERAALWALLRGSRRFVVVVACNEKLAERSLKRLKAELQYNDILNEDFPRTCYPIRKLEGQTRRAVGQLYSGSQTQIVWQQKEIVLPTIPGPDNEASGAVLVVCGLTSAVRGLSHVDAEGSTIRPDLLLVDDPQDRESANSVIQTAQRVELLNGDLLGLSGPRTRIAALAAVTVIQRGDLADQLLDREKSPAWQGERYRMMRSMPSNSELWDEYTRIRAVGLKAGNGLKAANEFYSQHRQAMDAGAEPSWPERFEPSEVSAIQHAMNLIADRGMAAFAAEYQNEPLSKSESSDRLNVVEIAKRCGGYAIGSAPVEVEAVTAFVDCGSLLYWMIVGFGSDFSAAVIDYGTWPQQRGRMFASAAAQPLLSIYPGDGDDGALYKGLGFVTGDVLGRSIQRVDGSTLRVSRLLIDSGWKTDVVRRFVRQSSHRSALLPSKGAGIGPQQVAIAEYAKRPGERLGVDWVMGAAGPDGLRLLRFDANAWKTRICGMLNTPMGVKGGIVLPGDTPFTHELLSHHLASEFPTMVEAKGRQVEVWQRRPNEDNHWLDCLVGCAVGATIDGIRPGGVVADAPKRKVRLSELQGRRRCHE